MKEKKLEDIDKKRIKMDLINAKLSLILPELMSRNLKLIERLKNKLKVSSFFNNIEHRNKKYFQDFIFSSNKRAKDLKTGLKIDKAIKQSSKTMSLLLRQMSEDIILKNADALLKEKKLISENTEQETHIKINELLQNLKNAVKTPYGTKIKPIKKIVKSLSQNEIKEAQEYITDKIKKEEIQIQEKVNKYLKKLNNSLGKYGDDEKNEDNNEENDTANRRNKIRRKKEFNKYAENFYFKEHIKFINYTKPKPFQIKDKESSNLKRIKNCLFPPPLEQLVNIQNDKNDDNEKTTSDNMSLHSRTFLGSNTNRITDKSNTNKKKLNKNSSMDNIKNNINISKMMSQTTKNNFIFDELYNIDVTGKDTLEVLNNLMNQGRNLSERMEKKSEKVNSLIDSNLPYPSSYELVLNYFKNSKNENINNKYFSYYPSSNNNIYKFNNIKNANKTLPEITPDMRKKLTLIKDDIKNFKNVNITNNAIFKPLFKTYLKQRIINNKNMDQNKCFKKKLSHKNSMDNILEKREKSIFITLKNLVNKEKNINTKRKVRSSNSIQNK